MPPQATAIDGFGVGVRYGSELAGTVGSVAGFAAWAVVRVDGASGDEILILDGNSGAIGWTLGSSAGGYYFRLGSTFGGGTYYQSPVGAHSPLGTIDRIAGVYDPSAARVRIYLNGAEVGAGTAFAGAPVLDAAAFNTTIGAGAAGADPAVSFAFLSAGFVPATPTPAAIASWSAQTELELGMTAIAGATYNWRAADAGSPPGATWVDAISGGSLARVGAPTAITFTPSW